MNRSVQVKLAQLARTRKLKDALKLVQELEVSHEFTWRPVGDDPENYGRINIGSDAGLALVERVTNAIDGVIEREAVRRLRKRSVPVPSSPREAAELWFKIAGGRVATVKPIERRQKLADDIVVSILDSDSKREPTIEIRDRGIGLTPSAVPKTILNLGGGNKVDKMYLAGAYGQGGSTALAFSPDGCLFVARRQTDLLSDGEEDLIAVTFARFNPLDLGGHLKTGQSWTGQNRPVGREPQARVFYGIGW